MNAHHSNASIFFFSCTYQVHEELHASGGDGAEAQARRILFGLGFDDIMQVRPLFSYFLTLDFYFFASYNFVVQRY